jgi:hypothetical protein
MGRRVADGFCLIIDEHGTPIFETRNLDEAGRLVTILWEKYGHRFHRSEPRSRRSYGGDGSRLRSLLNAHPLHARRAGSDKTICGGKVLPYETPCEDLTSETITCEFCRDILNGTGK